jgi:hypothetical protein
MPSAAILICVAAALIICTSAALTYAPAARLTCSPADLLSLFTPITGATNATKIVDTVIKASRALGASGVFWGSVFTGLVSVIAINVGVLKPDKFNDEQVDFARLNYVNAWM